MVEGSWGLKREGSGGDWWVGVVWKLEGGRWFRDSHLPPRRACPLVVGPTLFPSRARASMQ